MSDVSTTYLQRICNVSATYIDILAYAGRLSNVLNIQLAYNWRMASVSMAYGNLYPKRIADVLRKCNHRFPFLAGHTQSTLAIRLSYVGDR